MFTTILEKVTLSSVELRKRRTLLKYHVACSSILSFVLFSIALIGLQRQTTAQQTNQTAHISRQDVTHELSEELGEGVHRCAISRRWYAIAPSANAISRADM